MRSTLRSLWTWAAVALLILAWLPLLALARLFDRDPAHYRTGRLFRRLGAAITRVNPAWTIHIEGDLPDDPRRPYVVVCNHQSMADIPIISRLPWEMKWVAKAELFETPIVGWMMRLAGDIPVVRGDRRSGVEALAQARSYLARRCSVMFFPEGTRSRDGNLLRFNEGAFRLAIKTGTPVLPLALDGAQDTLPKHSWKFEHDSTIRLRVLPPISTSALDPDDTRAFAAEVRELIQAQLDAWRADEVAAPALAAAAPRKDSVKTPSPAQRAGNAPSSRA